MTRLDEQIALAREALQTAQELVETLPGLIAMLEAERAEQAGESSIERQTRELLGRSFR